MKKKIFLMLAIVAILVCALSISISAATYDTTRKVTLDSGDSVPLYDSEGYALTYYLDGTSLKSVKTIEVLSTGSATIDSNQYVTFKFKDVSEANIVLANFQDDKLGDLQVFNTKFQGSSNLEYCYMPRTLERLSVGYDSANVFRETTKCKIVDFPVDCELNFIGKYSFSKATALKEIYIPANVETFPDGSGWDWGCFWQCTSLTKVTFAEDSRLKNVPNGTFRDCTALTEILLPDSVETIGIYVFRNAGIVNSPFSPSSNCTYIAKWAFAYATNLQNINIPRNATFDTTSNPEGTGLFHECTSLEVVNFHPDTIDTLYPPYMFSSCSSLKSIKLSNNVTQLSVRMFNNCSNLETIVLGANVQGINSLRNLSDHNSFTYGCNNLKYVYLPKTLNISEETHSNACHAFSAGGNITFYFDGTYEEAQKLQNDFKTNVTSCGNNGKITGATIISLEEYEKLETISKCYIVYGYNTCDAFYNGVHEEEVEDNNPCWLTDCKNCGETGLYVGNESTHNYKYTVSYTNYFANGDKLGICQNANCECGKEYEVVDTVAPIISKIKGYATSEDGKEITFGYDIDKDALAYYNELADTALELGFVVAVNAYLDGAPLNSNGTEATLAKGKVVKTVTNAVYSSVDFRLTGKWDNNVTIGDEETQLKYVELFIAGYIFDGKVNYVNEDGSSTDYTTVVSVTHTNKPVEA